jgi:hypothetical protein
MRYIKPERSVAHATAKAGGEAMIADPFGPVFGLINPSG